VPDHGRVQMKLKPEAFGPCIQKIVDKAGISSKSAMATIQATANEAQLFKQRGESDPYGMAARKLADMMKDKAVKDRSDAIRNSMIRKGLLDDVHANGIENAALSIESAMVNVNTRIGQMKAPLEEVGQGLAFRWLTAIDVEMHKAGMSKAFDSGALDKEIARELWKLSQVGPKKPPSDAIAKAAFIINGPLYEAGERLKNGGAKFDHAIDYITRTKHNPRQMEKAGFDAWWKATEPRLHERVWDSLRLLTDEEGNIVETLADGKARFARRTYNGLLTGIHGIHGESYGAEGDGYIPPAFEGARNIAKSHSHERVLFWKDSDAWLDHMREFGGMTTLSRSVHETLLTASRHVALMDRFGTNPMGSLNMLIRQVEEHYRDIDPLAVNKFIRQSDHLRNVMAQLDGTANLPHNRDWNDLVNTLKNIENASMLGAVGLTHFSALPITMSSLAPHYDLSRFELFANNLKFLIQGAMSGEEYREIMKDAGAFTHGTLVHFWSEFKKSPTVPGKVSAIAAMTLKATGLNYVLENSQNGFRHLLMHKIGRDLDKSYGDLSPLLRNNLSKYQINEKEWNMLQGVKDAMVNVEDRRYATPKDFYNLKDDVIDDHIKDKVGALKQNIEDQRTAHMHTDAREENWARGRLANIDERLEEMRAGVEKRHAARGEKEDKLRDYFNDRDLEIRERMKAARLAQGRLHDVINMGTKENIREHLDEIRQAMEGERARMEAGEETNLDELFHDISLEEVKKAAEGTDRNVEEHTRILSKLAQNYGRLSLRMDQRIRAIAAQAKAKFDHMDDMAIKDVMGLKVKYDKMVSDVQEAAGRMEARIWSRAEKLEAMEKMLPEQIAKMRQQARWQLADNYAAFIAHAGKTATVAAGAREKAWAGSVVGNSEMGKLMMQFKMWPLAVINQVHGRELYSSLSSGQKAANFGWLLAFSAAGGMFRMAVRDASNGMPQRDPRDPKTLGAALMQGGGMGLLGDFLFGETNRMGGGLMDTLAGPVLGDAAALFKIFQKTRDDTYKLGEETVNGKGHYQDIWPDLIHFTKGHIPGANMIGLKGALDYAIWYHLYEAASPGYWKRMNDRLEKERGRRTIYGNLDKPPSLSQMFGGK
jgi:hypothetical protein